jgi:hypothetical protein
MLLTASSNALFCGTLFGLAPDRREPCAGSRANGLVSVIENLPQGVCDGLVALFGKAYEARDRGHP